MNKSVLLLPAFGSSIGSQIESFLLDKLACGYTYQNQIRRLYQFDRFLMENQLNEAKLPKPLVREWVSKRDGESLKTQNERFYLIRQFAEYLRLRGYEAYIPDFTLKPRGRSTFVPYIFSCEQLKLLFQESDRIIPSSRSPFRHLVIPEVFRLLYGTGLRLGEALRLTVADGDLDRGILTVRHSKFGKDRLVPLAPELALRLKIFQQKLGPRISSAAFFPKFNGERYGNQAIYCFFRFLLQKIGISHAGRGRGPRVHDLRHTFAVHRMMKWLQEGDDPTAMLPILAAYLGHKGLNETQHYLHLTLELAAELSSTLEAQYGHLIPGEVQP